MSLTGKKTLFCGRNPSNHFNRNPYIYGSFTWGRKSSLWRFCLCLSWWRHVDQQKKFFDLKVTSVWQWTTFAHKIPLMWCTLILKGKAKSRKLLYGSQSSVIPLDQWAVLPWQNQSDRNAWSHGQMLWWFGTGTLERHPEERCTSKTQGGLLTSLKLWASNPNVYV